MRDIKLDVKPKEIYVDYGRDYTTIWTNTKEVFVLSESNTLSIANQIRNFVSYLLICDETGDRIQIQDVKVYVDEVGGALKNCLKHMNIICGDITSGVRLKRLCREQDVIYVDKEFFNIRKNAFK